MMFESLIVHNIIMILLSWCMIILIDLISIRSNYKWKTYDR